MSQRWTTPFGVGGLRLGFRFRTHAQQDRRVGVAKILRTCWSRWGLYQVGKVQPNAPAANAPAKLKAKLLYLENAVRHSLKSFGIRMGQGRRRRLRAGGAQAAAELIDDMLTGPRALWRQYCRLHDLVMRTVARCEACWRFMAIRGVSPVTATSS